MVISSHALATQDAVRVLSNGGTVADAAIAGAATLCVVLPQKCTLGGDGFALVHHDGKTIGLNGTGKAPLLATPERVGSPIPRRGALSCTIPTIVRAWGDLHSRFGKVPWAQLFAGANAHARSGFPVS